MRLRNVPVIQLAALTALAIFAAACSNGSVQSMTGPTPTDGLLADHAGTGGNARYYGATGSTSTGPTEAGQVETFSVTITNCNGALTCDGVHVTQSQQHIGHAFIDIPAAFTGLSIVSTTPSNAADATWIGTLSGNRIQLEPDPGQGSEGTRRLNPGESVTVVFTATAPAACGPYTFVTSAYQDTGLTLNGTPYTLVPNVNPSFEVVGCGGCTVRGFGYWKTHPNAWPVNSLTLGNRVYSAAELLSIMNNNVSVGNGLISLAHHLIAAKLNVANGEDASIQSTIDAADALIGNLVVPPVGAGYLDPTTVNALKDLLEAYNEQCAD